jgi:hypothetical protein
MSERREIATAPRDGTPIYAYDGEWWRQGARWRSNNSFGPAGWYFQGWLRVEATHWCPDDAVDDELFAEVKRGYLSVGGTFSPQRRARHG